MSVHSRLLATCGGSLIFVWVVIFAASGRKYHHPHKNGLRSAAGAEVSGKEHLNNYITRGIHIWQPVYVSMTSSLTSPYRISRTGWYSSRMSQNLAFLTATWDFKKDTRSFWSFSVASSAHVISSRCANWWNFSTNWQSTMAGLSR